MVKSLRILIERLISPHSSGVGQISKLRFQVDLNANFPECIVSPHDSLILTRLMDVLHICRGIESDEMISQTAH